MWGERSLESRKRYSKDGVTNPCGLFIKSCKEGLKPIKSLVDTTITEWFNWAYKNRIVIAMTGGHTAFTPDGVPVSLQEMMELYPMTE